MAQSATPPPPSGRKAKGDVEEKDAAHTNQTLPHVGRPLDGSQYHDVVEEQIYAEQRPAPEPVKKEKEKESK